MIGIVLNSKNASVTDLQNTAKKLLLISSQVIIVSNDSFILNIFKKNTGIEIIPRQDSFTNENCLSEIFAASSAYPEKTDFITLSTNYSNLKPAILTNLSNNPNCFAATIKHSYYTISHFYIDNHDLSQYLSLEDFDLDEFITQEIQCLPLTFSSGDMF